MIYPSGGLPIDEELSLESNRRPSIPAQEHGQELGGADCCSGVLKENELRVASSRTILICARKH